VKANAELNMHFVVLLRLNALRDTNALLGSELAYPAEVPTANINKS
jgi:hypothetical protein